MSKHVISKLSKKLDFILLQTHCLFECQLSIMKGIYEDFNGAGKAVDFGDPIIPVQIARAYDGIGIIWKKTSSYTELTDGGNRIQCVAIRMQRPILLISTYMPCKGINNNYETFLDCLDQLNEILIEYDDTHDVVL